MERRALLRRAQDCGTSPRSVAGAVRDMAKRSKPAEARDAPLLPHARTAQFHEVIRQAGAAMLVTHDSSGLAASHVPVWLDPASGPFGTLHGYLRRTDPLARPHGPPPDALMIVIGSGAMDGLIAAHAQGRLNLYDDPERLAASIGRLVRNGPALRAADDMFGGETLAGLIGFELRITVLDGVSETLPGAARQGRQRLAVAPALVVGDA